MLRIADIKVYAHKKSEYELMSKLIEIDVPMPRTIDFGICNENKSVYTLLEWIDGNSVDFNNYFGDPWYDFNRIGIEYPAFALGQIDGYFDNEPPEDFWKLLAYYHSASAITSIVWAKYFAPDEMDSIIQLNKDIVLSYDGMNNLIPAWYQSRYNVKEYLRRYCFEGI